MEDLADKYLIVSPQPYFPIGKRIFGSPFLYGLYTHTGHSNMLQVVVTCSQWGYKSSSDRWVRLTGVKVDTSQLWLTFPIGKRIFGSPFLYGLYTRTGHSNMLQVVVLASLAQLLVFVELARCTRSIQIEIKDVICM